MPTRSKKTSKSKSSTAAEKVTKAEDGNTTTATTTTSEGFAEPPIIKDPRFVAGRHLIQSGRSREGSVDIFATLVEEARSQYGDTSLEAAVTYYEYGNALFRSKVQELQQEQQQQEEEQKLKEEQTKKIDEEELRKKRILSLEKKGDTNDDADMKPKARTTRSSSNDKIIKSIDSDEVVAEVGEIKQEKDDDNGDDDDEGDDIELALEMMENSWSILDEYVQQKLSPPYYEWVCYIQQPRNLLGIGDVLSQLGRHADAADAYTRALAIREEEMQKYYSNNDDVNKSNEAASTKTTVSIDQQIKRLICQRRICEANILVAEELLACPENEDVRTTETNELLTSASERIDYARGYYDKARDELQETVFFMGEIAAAVPASGSKAAADQLKAEKEDVCFLATLVMGVGTTLAEYDEKEHDEVDDDEKSSDGTPKKKKKKTG